VLILVTLLHLLNWLFFFAVDENSIILDIGFMLWWWHGLT